MNEFCFLEIHNLMYVAFPFQVEASLSQDDYGRDLASVQNLIKKHQLVEADITAHEVGSYYLFLSIVVVVVFFL